MKTFVIKVKVPDEYPFNMVYLSTVKSAVWLPVPYEILSISTDEEIMKESARAFLMSEVDNDSDFIKGAEWALNQIFGEDIDKRF